MEKSTTQETPFSKKVVVGCGPIIRRIKWVKPPTLLTSNLTNTDDEMAD